LRLLFIYTAIPHKANIILSESQGVTFMSLVFTLTPGKLIQATLTSLPSDTKDSSASVPDEVMSLRRELHTAVEKMDHPLTLTLLLILSCVAVQGTRGNQVFFFSPFPSFHS
jgi:hypothetical protein